MDERLSAPDEGARLPRRSDRHRKGRRAAAPPAAYAASAETDTSLEPRHAPSSRRARRRARPRPDYLLVVLVVLALGKALLSRGLGLGTAGIGGLLLEAATVVLILSAVDLVFPRPSYTLDIVVYTVLSAVMLANVMYVSFFGEIFSPHLLSVVGQAADVSDSVNAMLKPVYLLYFLDIPFLIGWGIMSYRSRRTSPVRRRRVAAVVAVVALVAFLVQVFLVLQLSAGADGMTVARTRGFGPFQIASIVRLAMPDPAAQAAQAFEHSKTMTPAQAAQAQIEGLRRGSDGAPIGGIKFGQYRGKNVIVIQVEALQQILIGRRYNGHEITPNLNKLVGTSWYFPNTYSETSAGNTVDAEFTVNTSLYAPTYGAASLEYADRELPGLPRLLRNEGYDAITLHVNDVRFWNRIELYPALGFRKWWDRSYFQNRDKMWHASDEILFSYGMKVLKTEQQPFYSFLITESSHIPFKAIPVSREPLKLLPADSQTLSGKYIAAESYTDLAIGEFVASLKKNGLWDNSIVMIYGDHSAMLDRGANKGDSKVADQLLGRPYSDVDRQRIPLIVHLPGQARAQVNTKPVGQVDFMPTIAELVGLDLKEVPHFGRSAFVDAPALVPTRAYEAGGTFIDDTMMFMPGLGFDDGKGVSVLTDQTVTPGGTERAWYAATQKLDLLSDAWVKSLPQRAGATNGKNAIIPH